MTINSSKKNEKILTFYYKKKDDSFSFYRVFTNIDIEKLECSLEERIKSYNSSEDNDTYVVLIKDDKITEAFFHKQEEDIIKMNKVHELLSCISDDIETIESIL